MNKILLALLALCTLFLSIYGINWGVPSEERMKLYFNGQEELSDALNLIKEKQEGFAKSLPGYYYNPIRSYHPDESNFIKAIGNMNPGRLDFNPHYYFYGMIYFYFLVVKLGVMFALGYIKQLPLAALYAAPAELAKLYTTARMVTVFFSTVAVYGIYLLGKKLYGFAGGITAAFFLAVTPMFVINTHYISPDVPMLAFFIFSIYFFLEKGKRSSFLIAGIIMGVALNTKYTAMLLLPAFYLYYVFYEKPAGLKQILPRLFTPDIIIYYLSAALAFLITFPYLFTSFSEAAPIFKAFVSYTSIKPEYDMPNWKYYLRAFYYGLGPLMFLTFAAGMVCAFINRRRENILLVMIAAFYLLFFMRAVMRLDRYMLPAMPSAALLSAYFLTSLLKGRKHLWAAAAVITVGFFICLSYDDLFASKNVRTEAGEWINAEVPAGSSLGLFRLDYQFVLPPVNMRKYKFNYYISADFQENGDVYPDYLILSSVEYEEWPQVRRIFGGVKSQYKLIKEFNRAPRFLGFFEFNKNPSHDYQYIYPSIKIYKSVYLFTMSDLLYLA